MSNIKLTLLENENCTDVNNGSLYFTNPELRNEWDDVLQKMKEYIPVKNKVRWKCKTGKLCHRYFASINSRTIKVSLLCW